MFNQMSTLRLATSRVALTRCAIRAFSTAPGGDPLELMRATFMKRGVCDESGFRMPGVHWTMALAFGVEDPMKVGIAVCCIPGETYFIISNELRVCLLVRISNNSLRTSVPSEFSVSLIWV